MIDYSEGCHELKSLVHELYQLCIQNEFTEAREVCDQIVATARMTRAKIGLQRDEQDA